MTSASTKHKVAIVMGSKSDYATMKNCEKILKLLKVKFETKIVSAHRTPERMFKFAKSAEDNNISVIIAGAGGSAHLPGMIASLTTIPVIGVPIKASLDGLDSLLAIVQMPPGIPVATVGINGALNAGILAAQIIGAGDDTVYEKTVAYKASLKDKIVNANEELKQHEFKFRIT